MGGPVPTSTIAGIYAITNTLNGKQYIGSAVNLTNRWRQHRGYLSRGNHDNPRLQQAWRKYGADAFTFTVLEHVSDVTLLIVREQHYMDTLQPAYNLLPVAMSSLGYKHSPETRARMSAAQKGRKQTPAQIASIHAMHAYRRAAGIVIRPSAEGRARISAVKKGRKRSPEEIAKQKATRQENSAGKPLSERQLAGYERRKQNAQTPEGRARMLVGARKRGDKRRGTKLGPMPAETRAKLSAAKKGRTMSPEGRLKRSLAAKGKPWSEAKRRAFERSRARSAARDDLQQPPLF
jgi:group I intron endonuclease